MTSTRPVEISEENTRSHGEINQQERPSASAPNESRPPIFHSQQSQMDSRYVNMLLALDSISSIDNMLASFFTWILLAGFVLFPGTFTSLQSFSTTNGIEQRLVDAIGHVSL